MMDKIKDVINFYSPHAEYGCFSNFSGHKVKLDGKTWQTSEHYFQAQKFATVKSGEKHMNDVYKAKGPMKAANIGRDRKRPLRRDWEKVKDEVMYKVVRAKVLQHESIKKTLLSTGDAILVEDTYKDSYWGNGGDGSGRNQLGKTLMRIRKELMDEDD
jgi:ribA/ribD-fused uncharacterized protein